MNYSSPPIDPTDPQGTDLALDVNGDLIITTQGDISTIDQTNNIKQMIRVRLQTIPDSYIFGTDLGSELGTTIDAPLNPHNVNLIEQYVRNALAQDSRVLQVNSLNVKDPNDGSMQFYLSLNLTVIGGQTIQTTVPIGGGMNV